MLTPKSSLTISALLTNGSTVNGVDGYIKDVPSIRRIGEGQRRLAAIPLHQHVISFLIIFVIAAAWVFLAPPGPNVWMNIFAAVVVAAFGYAMILFMAIGLWWL